MAKQKKGIEEIIAEWGNNTFKPEEKEDQTKYQAAIKNFVFAVRQDSPSGQEIGTILQDYSDLARACREDPKEYSLIDYAADRYGWDVLHELHKILDFMREKTYFDATDINVFIKTVAVNIQLHEGFKSDFLKLAGTGWDSSEENLQKYHKHLELLHSFMLYFDPDEQQSKYIQSSTEAFKKIFWALNGKGDFWLPGIVNTRIIEDEKAINDTPFDSWIDYLEDIGQKHSFDDLDFRAMQEFNRRIVDEYVKGQNRENIREFDQLLSLFSHHFISGKFEDLNALIWEGEKNYESAWELNRMIRDQYFDLFYGNRISNLPDNIEMAYTKHVNEFSHIPTFTDMLLKTYKIYDAIPILRRFFDITRPYEEIRGLPSDERNFSNRSMQIIFQYILYEQKINYLHWGFYGTLPLDDIAGDPAFGLIDHLDNTIQYIKDKNIHNFKKIEERFDLIERIHHKIRIYDALTSQYDLTPKDILMITLHELRFPTIGIDDNEERLSFRGFYDDYIKTFDEVDIEYEKHNQFIEKTIASLIKDAEKTIGPEYSRYLVKKPAMISSEEFYGLDHQSSKLYRRATFENHDYWMIRAQNYLYEKKITQICPNPHDFKKAVFVAMGGGTMDEELALIFEYLRNFEMVDEVIIYNVEESHDMIDWTKRESVIEDDARWDENIGRKVNFKIISIEKNFLEKDFDLVNELALASHREKVDLALDDHEMYIMALTNLPGNLPEVDGQDILIKRMAQVGHAYSGKVIVGLGLDGDPTDYQNFRNWAVSQRPLDVLGIPSRYLEYKPTYVKERKRWEFNIDIKEQYSKLYSLNGKKAEVIYPEGYRFTVQPFSRRFTLGTKPEHSDYFYAGSLFDIESKGINYTQPPTAMITNVSNLNLDSRLLERVGEDFTLQLDDWGKYICTRSDLSANFGFIEKTRSKTSEDAYAFFMHDFAPA
ncbi:MAG: hypothetical protein KKF44_01420 [Nanoarchaeota archaeon]|nr:hypothetical protein [Nanoarchaeota archaeon]